MPAGRRSVGIDGSIPINASTSAATGQITTRPVQGFALDQRQGRIPYVRVTITVPGRAIVVGRDPGEHHAHKDVYVAIRDAFDAARRQLEDHAQTSRDEVKTHVVPDHGGVESLIADQGYGFIAAVDGNTIYWGRCSAG